MTVTVFFASPLVKWVDNESELSATGSTVGEVLKDCVERYSQLGSILFDEHDNLRKTLNVFLNDKDVRALDLLQTPVSDNDEIAIIPTISGG